MCNIVGQNPKLVWQQRKFLTFVQFCYMILNIITHFFLAGDGGKYKGKCVFSSQLIYIYI